MGSIESRSIFLYFRLKLDSVEVVFRLSGTQFHAFMQEDKKYNFDFSFLTCGRTNLYVFCWLVVKIWDIILGA